MNSLAARLASGSFSIVVLSQAVVGVEDRLSASRFTNHWQHRAKEAHPHGLSSKPYVKKVEGCGFDSQGTHILMKMYNLNAIVSRFG